MFKHSRILARSCALRDAATLTAGAASAFAAPKPLPNDGPPLVQPQPITVEQVSNGSPIWVFRSWSPPVTALLSVAAVLATNRLRRRVDRRRYA